MRSVRTVRMKAAFLHQLVLRRDETVRRWLHTLKEAPVYSALGNPETLRYMIGPTLDRLFMAVREHVADGWSPEAPPAKVRLMEAASRCALNPMIGYYLAGEAALVSVVKEIAPCADFSETDLLVSESQLLTLLREMGRAEITGFCEICRVREPVKAMAGHTCSGLPETCPFKAAHAERQPVG